MRQKILIITSLLLLISCKEPGSDKGDSSNPKVQNLAIPAKEFGNDTVTAEVRGSDIPGRYTVDISWPASSAKIQIKNDEKIIFSTTDNETSFSFEALAGISFYLKIEKLSPSGEIDRVVFRKIEVPQDLVISVNTKLKEDLRFRGGRFFLINGATLEIGSFNLDLQVQELVSERGIIQTYPMNTKMPWDVSAPAGGDISIRTGKATGLLTVNLRGAEGGDGRNGIKAPMMDAGCNGSDAGNGGYTGSIMLSAKDSAEFDLRLQREIGNPGKQSCGKCAYPEQTPDKVYPPCRGEGLPGAPGKPGAIGKACYKYGEDKDYACL